MVGAGDTDALAVSGKIELQNYQQTEVYIVLHTVYTCDLSTAISIR